jgi:protein-disulfide isomerase
VDNSDKRHTMPPWKAFFEIVSTLLMLGLAAVLVWQGWTKVETRGALSRPTPTPMPVPQEPVSIAGASVLGASTAKVAMIEYSDFECGACAVFANTIKPTLMREYIDTGRVLFVFKSFPVQMHVRAPAMAAAAKCVGRQGKFWEMHDRLFAAPHKSEDAELLQTARELDIDSQVFEACRAEGQTMKEVEAEKAEGKKLQVSATPTFFFGRVISGGRVQITEGTIGTDLEFARQTLDRLLR